MPDRSDEANTVSDVSALSPSESRVLDEALRGLSVREIAERLVLTEATVKTHLTHIYAKLGVRGRVALLARFRRPTSSVIEEPPPTAIPAEPPSRPSGSWLGPTAVVVVALVVLAIAAVIAAGRGPRPVTLASILESVETGRVAELQLSGDVLTATLTSGDQYQVTGVEPDDVSDIAAENGVPFGISPNSPVPETLLYGFNLAGYLLVAGLVWLWWGWPRSRQVAVS